MTPTSPENLRRTPPAIAVWLLLAGVAVLLPGSLLAWAWGGGAPWIVTTAAVGFVVMLFAVAVAIQDGARRG